MVQNAERVRTKELTIGQVLMEDIYLGNRKIIGKGSVLTSRMIEFLIHKKIREVDVLATYDQFIGELEPPVIQEATYFADHVDYIVLLGKLNIEFRYGKGIQRNDHISYVIDLFEGYMNNTTYRYQLEMLKSYNYYTFLHAIDVFTMCTMFAREKKIPNLEKIALGFLFHDIGKLQVPDAILNKKTKLTRTELEIVQRHPVDGYQKLCEIGLESIAYLAMSHHENASATGYPAGVSCLTLPLEVQLLQIVDVYSALTLQRSYKEPLHPNEAITLMFNNKQNYNDQLLKEFTNFIGIFPKNSVVLLSDGSQAVVESTDVPNPLLPKLRLFKNGQLFQIPYDFKIYISKMISYNEMSLEYVFKSLSEAILNAEIKLARKYFDDLLDWYQSYEWFTHIHIPLFKIIKVLEKNHILAQDKLHKIKETFHELMRETMLKLSHINPKKHNALVLVNEDVTDAELVALFEGVLYSEEIYPVVIRKGKSASELAGIINSLKIKQLFVLENYELELQPNASVEVFHIMSECLEKMLKKLTYKDLHKEQIIHQFQCTKYQPYLTKSSGNNVYY